MGQSPSADVFFGYDLGDMEDHDTWESLKPAWWQELEENEEDADWEDELARRLGWVEAPFPDDFPKEDHSIWRLPSDQLQEALEVQQRAVDEYEKTSPAYQAYSENRAERRALLARIPVKLDNYGCDGGDAAWALQVKASVQSVSDWESTPLKPLDVDPEWVGQVARFVELLELKVPAGGPGWHLNCSYG
jgi:hypothetical protein